MPAVPLAADNNLCFKRWAVLFGKFYLMSNVAVRGTDNCADFADLEAVVEIMLLKLVCCGNCYRPELMKSKH